jgi:hypothetical protein
MLHSSKTLHLEHPLKLSFKNVFSVHKYTIKNIVPEYCLPTSVQYVQYHGEICCTVSELSQLGLNVN